MVSSQKTLGARAGAEAEPEARVLSSPADVHQQKDLAKLSSRWGGAHLTLAVLKSDPGDFALGAGPLLG